jgi:hypothetical protein
MRMRLDFGAVVQSIEVGNPRHRFPIAVVPIGKSNDVSRAIGWGSVYKQDFHNSAVIPDVLSAVASGPIVSVDCWNVSAASSDKKALRDLPRSFAGDDVRACCLGSLLATLPRLWEPAVCLFRVLLSAQDFVRTFRFASALNACCVWCISPFGCETKRLPSSGLLALVIREIFRNCPCIQAEMLLRLFSCALRGPWES